MDGAQHEVRPRVQFRLNLNVPEELTLYDELQHIPSGKRNSIIVARLLHGSSRAELEDAYILAIKKAFREILAEYQFQRTVGADDIPASSTPNDLFDITPFLGGIHGINKT